MKTRIIYTLLLSVVVLASCKNFIDLTSQTLLPSEKFYKTETDISLAVIGVYSLLRTNYNVYFYMNEMPSDNVETHTESEAGLGVWDKLTWNPQTTAFENIWINYYNTISQCNTVLSTIDGVTFTNATVKAQYISEMKFIRALMYFELVRSFGEVPLVLELLTSDKKPSSYLRKPVDEIYTQIEKDLTEAMDGLPAVYTEEADKGRVTSVAVKALLGKVYLYWNQKIDQAVLKLAEVVADPNYGLMQDPKDVFSITDEYNKEIIFTVQYSRKLAGVGEGSNFALNFLPELSGLTTLVNWSQNMGTLDLYRIFKNADKRKNLIGVHIRKNAVDSTSADFYYYTKKFLDNPPTNTDGENNWIVIRYADVLLLYAEALYKQGKTQEALKEVNKVRLRAGLSEWPSTLSAEQTLAAIKLERRLELCYEGHRWPDLVRWGDYLTVMNAFKANYKVSAMLPDEHDKLFPIPNRERVINPDLTQNTGY